MNELTLLEELKSHNIEYPMLGTINHFILTKLSQLQQANQLNKLTLLDQVALQMFKSCIMNELLIKNIEEEAVETHKTILELMSKYAYELSEAFLAEKKRRDDAAQ